MTLNQVFFLKFCNKGGTSRGNAMGNVYNWGDAAKTEPSILPQKGLVFLYFSKEDPSTIIPIQSLPTMKTHVQVFNSTKPLFETIAKKFPDVASKSMLFILFAFLFSLYFQQNMSFLSMMWSGHCWDPMMSSHQMKEMKKSLGVLKIIDQYFMCFWYILFSLWLLKSDKAVEYFCFVEPSLCNSFFY